MRSLLTFVFLIQLQVVLAQERRWVPDYGIVQYAGSIGFSSVGIGYEVLKKHHFSLHYGYVPERNGGRLNIATAKVIFGLNVTRLSESLTLRPADVGFMVTYHFGHQFHSSWPKNRYPEGYYWWKTSIRPHLLMQTSLTLDFDERKIRSLTGYVEFNTNELYLVSYLKNIRSLRPSDIIKVGIGIRAGF